MTNVEEMKLQVNNAQRLLIFFSNFVLHFCPVMQIAPSFSIALLLDSSGLMGTVLLMSIWTIKGALWFKLPILKDCR